MQLRPSLSARFSEAMLRSASKFERRAPKTGVRALPGLSFPFALHRETESEKLPMPARRDVDWPEFHLVAGRGPHESDA